MTNYTKEQLHEAYSVEYYAHQNTQATLKQAERRIAAMKYDRDEFEKKYFRELVLKTIPGVDKEDIDIFFSSNYDIIWIGKGYIGIIKIADETFIAFLYKGNSYSTLKEIVAFLRGKELIYEPSKTDLFFNNSSKVSGNIHKIKIGD